MEPELFLVLSAVFNPIKYYTKIAMFKKIQRSMSLIFHFSVWLHKKEKKS